MINDSEQSRHWRVGHQGRDQMYYEELRDGAWERIAIDGEMLTGRAHHVIYFATPERWLHYPPWAQGRRDEILARITSEFREPDYEYYGLDQGGAPPAAGPAEPRISPTGAPARKAASAPAGMRALMVAVLLMFALAAAMGWLVARGMARGETTLPMQRATLRRAVARAQEPGMYWFAIGLYSAVGIGALALGAFGVREGWRLK